MNDLKIMASTLLLASIILVSCKKDSDDKKDPDKNFDDGNYPASHFSNKQLNPALTYGELTDIEGNKYPTIKIGNQVWMAENLKTAKYNDGSQIKNVTNATEWNNLREGAWVNIDNDKSNDAIYGKLYNWYAVQTKKLCPKGWHIPTDEEWTALNDFLTPNTGVKMKSAGNMDDGNGLWEKVATPGREGTNESGFTGLPTGFRYNNEDATFNKLHQSTFWWASTPYTGDKVDAGTASWARQVASGGNLMGPGYYYNVLGFCCRCMLD